MLKYSNRLAINSVCEYGARGHPRVRLEAFITKGLELNKDAKNAL